MRAVVQYRYGSADVLAVEEIARPEIGDDEVLVRVHAAGLDRGVWHLMAGLPHLVRLVFGLRAPRNPVCGMDVAGRVEATGKNVTRFRVGEEVFGTCSGSFAEYACVRQNKLAPKPANLTLEQAAAVPVSGLTAFQGLRDSGELSAGQSVLITGASGGVGTFAVQIAKALGAEVTGVCSESKMDLVRSIGADHVIDYVREDFTRSGRSHDVILDIAGNRSLTDLRRVLAPRGILVITGGEQGGRWLGGTDRQLRAALLAPFVRQKLRSFICSESSENLRALTELIEAGKVTPVVDRTFPLSEIRDAMRYLVEGRASGKIVITV
ncbi:MAG: NAD(P)-dependent alcohol dehydrogenase [bacterium]|nr:NAD(P)-dependent alcohol dehydrogenase [bacterium]